MAAAAIQALTQAAVVAALQATIPPPVIPQFAINPAGAEKLQKKVKQCSRS
jgi:hypothetical protein